MKRMKQNNLHFLTEGSKYMELRKTDKIKK